MSGFEAAGNVLKHAVLEEKDKKDTNIVPKDFYWDQIMFYLVSGILGLSFLDISVEFFRGSEVQCFTSTDILLDRDHYAYLNDHCYGSLPHSQYYLVFSLISALLMIIPHYLWSAYFGKHFDFFFGLLKNLDRLHDPNTGEYKPANFAFVQKLENKFSNLTETKIFISYASKLIIQLMVSIVAFMFNALYFKDSDFNENFTCKVSLNDSIWPFSTEVPCVYNSLRLLWFLRLSAFILMAGSILVMSFGLLWCKGKHADELGSKEIARFCYHSFLQPDKHNFPSFFQTFRKALRCKHSCSILTLSPVWFIYICTSNCLKKLNLGPTIKTDLDFLLLKLYFADSGHGQVFRDIQIKKELQNLIEHDHELLHLLLRTHADIMKQKSTQHAHGPHTQYDRAIDLQQTFLKAGFTAHSIDTAEYSIYSQVQREMGLDARDWSVSPLRNVLYGFLQFVEGNDVVMDISFELKYGYALVLARAFKNVTTVYFDRYYRPGDGQEQIGLIEKYQANYDIVTYPDNIFSHTADHIVQSDNLITELFEEEERPGYNLIIVGPITDRSKLISTNLLVNKIYENKHIAESATLIAVRPLFIGDQLSLHYFQQYIPPQGLFESVDIIDKLLDRIPVYVVTKSGLITRVKKKEDQIKNNPFGVGVICENVRCIFEFTVYKYNGRFKTTHDPPNNNVEIICEV